MIGEQLGHYRITRRLSEGGMGEVYVAEHVLIGRQAAIKLLLPQISRNEEIVKRFFNEARATSAIGHPGIVQIFDFGLHTDGRAYCVMEFLEGEPLETRIKKHGKLALGHSIDMLKHVCSALGAAHRKGIVHRDLKPDNIFLVPDPGMRFGERAKLLDFGIAKLQDGQSEASKTRTGMVMGTPSYMAPEQCRGAGEVDHRADLYALGCIFFAMLCGRPPFVGAGAGELIGMQQFMEPPRPRSIEPSIDAHTEALILRLLQKNPDARAQSTDELAAELELLEAHLGTAPHGRAPTAPPVAVMATLPQAPAAAASTPAPFAARPSTPAIVAAPPGTPAPFPAVTPAPIAGRQSSTTLHSAAMERPGTAAAPTRAPRRWIGIAAGAAVAAAAGITALALTGSGETPAQDTTTIAATSTTSATEDPDPQTPEPAADTRPEPGTPDPPESTEAATAEAPPADIKSPPEDIKSPPEDVTTPPAAVTVELIVESTPPGATVRLGRKVLGTTPYTHTAPQGSQELSFKLDLDGHISRTVSFSTKVDDTKHVRLDPGSAPSSGSTTRKGSGSKQIKPPDTKDPFSK